MSVNQSKNIKDNAPVEEKKYRSIRLTKAHREDMASAVMKQWDKDNPSPADGSFREYLIAVLTKYRTATRSTPPESRGFARWCKAAESMIKVYDDLSLPNDFYPNSDLTFNLEIMSSTGEISYNYLHIPKSLADALGIPYLETQVVQLNIPTAAESDLTHVLDNEGKPKYTKTEVIKIMGKHGFTLKIPHDDPVRRKYLDQSKLVAQHNKDRTQMLEEVMDTLNQFNTTNQLREGWPDMVQYMPAHIADPEAVIQLPVLAISRLNERLGIQKK